jgi:hypothetical protein
MSQKYTLDVELQLRDIADGAETSTVDETGVALDVLQAGDFKVIFEVSALDTADADETYTLVVDTDSEAGFGDTPVQVGSVTVTAVGTFEVPLSAEFVEHLDADAAAIRVGAVIGGTTPSITYGAYVVPVR